MIFKVNFSENRGDHKLQYGGEARKQLSVLTGTHKSQVMAK